MSLVAAGVEALKRRLGRGGWLDGPEMDPFLVDERRAFRGDAVLVARPAGTGEVAEVVELCCRHGLAVVAQGGNTSLSGGSVPSVPVPTVLLSLSRMRAIEEVNADRFTITAQAGVTIQELQDTARAAGRTFAADWGARGTATIGGAVATNAGGMNVLRYGTIRNQILGLEVVMADGRVWNGLRALRKDSSGYDLKQLFIGSEGTLGIVTRAVVKLHPLEPEQRSAFAALRHIDELNQFYNLASDMAAGSLTAFELVPELGVSLVCDKYPNVTRPVDAISDWYVLLRLSGRGRVDDQLLGLLAAATDAGLVTDAVVAETPSQDANLWVLRDELSPVRLLDGYILKYDRAVPIDRISELHREVRAEVDHHIPGAIAYAFGHVGDGNIHLSVWPGDADPGLFTARIDRLRAAIDALTWRFEGTISAEHGIGQELVERLGGQKSEVELDLMRRIKHALDPDQQLNPGKLLPAR